jgi:hypothetical protein
VSDLLDGLWHPMASLPTDSTMVWAETADGRQMRWPASVLRMAMSDGVPEHIAFPAVRWSYSRGDGK